MTTIAFPNCPKFVGDVIWKLQYFFHFLWRCFVVFIVAINFSSPDSKSFVVDNLSFLTDSD